MIRNFDYKRVLNLAIDPCLVSRILSGESYIINLPIDAMLIKATAPYQIHGWVLTFYHESFPEIADGLEIPSLMAICKTRESLIEDRTAP